MPSAVENTSPSRPRRRFGHVAPLTLGAAILGACAAGTVGLWSADAGADAPGPRAGVAAVVFAALSSGTLAALYCLAAAGFGRLVVRATRPRAAPPRELEVLVGLGTMLAVSHLLGWLGALGGVTAWLVVGAGVVVWAASLQRSAPASDPGPRRLVHAWWLLALPGVSVMLAAASSPPGWLWTSEAGGYDTLSYHLQLVREWLDAGGPGSSAGAGRLTPRDHNVYSYLPSYAEGAFLHLAHMGVPLRSLLGAGAAASVGSLPEIAILGAAWLHALVAVLAGVGLARAASTILGEARETAVLAGAALLAVPWTVVVGSLAYNEMFVVALGVGCVLAGVQPGLTPITRAVLIGLMGAAAVGAKPTAVFMLAPLVLASVVIPSPLPLRRDWLRFAGAAVLVGTLVGSPWLVRNAVASGNPVFPFARAAFGDRPWTAEQHERYAAAHQFHGTPADRFAAAFALQSSRTPTNGPARGLGGQPRGIFHQQWSILFPLGIAGLVLGLFPRRTHRQSAAMLAALIAQLGAWLAFTHIQSRFLLPCVIPLALGIALGLEALRSLLGDTHRARAIALGLGAASVAWLGVRTVLIFAGEQGGRPNAMLAFGVDGLTGEPIAHQFLHMPPQMRDEAFASLPGPEVFVNAGGLDRFLPASDAAPSDAPPVSLYLFGDSTPFYYTHPRIRILYHTTYDAPPWGAVADPAAWASALRKRGVQFVVVNASELARLQRSAWYDPAVTPELVEKFVNEHTRVVAAWPRRGQRLCILNEPTHHVHAIPAGPPR